MEPKSYYCTTCEKVFSVLSTKDRKGIPCPSCGAMSNNLMESPLKGVSAKGEKGAFSVIVNGTIRKAGSFSCRVCKHSFSFDTSFGNQAACPRCRGTDCEPTSPSVIVFAGSKVKTLREQKRTRFLLDTWKELGKLREYREGLRSAMDSLDVISEETKRDVISSVDRALAEADRIRQERARIYDKVRS